MSAASAIAGDPARAPSAAAWARSHRAPLLDCVRGVAIAMVVIYHVAAVYDGAALDAVARFFHRYGAQGVDIFFPLSGYLITRFLLTRHEPGSIKVFFMRRFFRIVPLYMTAVTLFLAAMILVGFDAYLIDRIWIPYTFLTAWFMAADGHGAVPYAITWTLSVEEFAYVCFGLFALMSRRFLPLFLLVCTVAPTLLRLWMYAHEIGGAYYLPLSRIDSIAAGGLVSWAMLRRPPGTVLAGLAAALAAVAGLAALAGAGSDLSKAVGFLYIPLATSLVIVASDGWLNRLSWLGRDNPVVAGLSSIGFYSYFTYLIHYFNIYAIALLCRAAGLDLPPFWVFVALAFGLTHLQAVLSYRWFEGPLIRYGRRRERPRGVEVPAGAMR